MARQLADPAQAEVQARRIAAGWPWLWQAALLIQHAPPPSRTPSWAAGWRRAAAFSRIAGADVRAILRAPGRTPRMLNFPTSYRLTHLERHAFPARTQQQAADAALESLNRSPARTPSSAWAPLHRRPLHRRLARFGRIAGTWPARAQRARLAGHGLKVLDLNDVRSMPIYVDGADEINAGLHMIRAAAAR